VAKQFPSIFGALTKETIEKLLGYVPLTEKEAKKIGVAARRYIKKGTPIRKGAPTRSRRSVEQEVIQRLEGTSKSSGLLERRREENRPARQGSRKTPRSISDQVKAYIETHPDEVEDLRTKSGKISIREVQRSEGFKKIKADIKKLQSIYSKTGKGGYELVKALYELYRTDELKELYERYEV
jgi:hypothetical protein